MVSNIETKPMETGTSCKSFDGGADKYVGSVVAAKGWPSGIISGGNATVKENLLVNVELLVNVLEKLEHVARVVLKLKKEVSLLC